jgi:uncharacterized repeat protein (TIGR02543 family)
LIKSEPEGPDGQGLFGTGPAEDPLRRKYMSCWTRSTILTGLLILVFLGTSFAQVPRPARIGGTLTVNGVQITEATDAGYVVGVKKTNGSAFAPAAVDMDGLNASNFYIVDIPIYDASAQPGGAQPGSQALIYATKDGVPLTISQPPGGAITVGAEGSVTRVDIVATAGQVQTRTLSVTVSGSGTVTSTPAGINCGASCTAAFAEGSTVTLTATPAAGWKFDGWSGACTGATCSVTMNANKSVTATFSPITYTLTVNKSGQGTVTSSPAGINCGADCGEAYNSGTVVTLTAAPATGYKFDGWSGACAGTGTCTLTMDANKTATAAFSIIVNTLRVLKTGQGTVTSTPAGINCGPDCTEGYNYGTQVSLTAAPASGWTFGGWSGACTGTGTCQVTMNDAKKVGAVFLSWQSGTAVPDGGGAYTRWSYMGSAVSNGLLWLVGGRRDAGWNVLDNVGTYNPATGAWKTDWPKLNLERFYLAAAANEKFVFALGGRDRYYSWIENAVERFLVNGGTAWQNMAPLPEARMFGAAVIDGDYLYFIGGSKTIGSTSGEKNFWRYNLNTNTWNTTLAQLPTELSLISAAVIKGKIYIPGDVNSATTYVYNIATNSWSQIAPNGGVPPAWDYQCIAVGNEVWRIGGRRDVGGTEQTVTEQTVKEVWVLNTVTNTWSQYPLPMNNDRMNFAAGLVGPRVAVAGGVQYPNFTPTMTTEYLNLGDSDNDGIADPVEKAGCSDPVDADTDDDGIPDGIEDANKNGVVDPGETNPCNADSDGDGIQDGTELGYTVAMVGPDTDRGKFKPDLDPATKSDPLKSDTDGDGLTDGQEDLNKNGRFDQGETTPGAQSVFYIGPGGQCGGKTPCYGTVQAAVNAAGVGMILRLREGAYNENVTISGGKELTFIGGYDATFTANPGTSSLKSLTISGGLGMFERMELK